MRAVLLAFVLVAAGGCGPSEPPVLPVSGTVTFAGQPIPRGSISFDPKGSGKMGVADITDGKFDTQLGGRGVPAGSYVIRVSGYDGKQGTELPFGQPLFPEYTVEKEIAAGSTSLTIDVPRKK